jgi:uncharacterized RDD family membrane protein YckC
MNEIPQPPSTNPFSQYQPTIEDRRVGFGPRLGAWLLDQIGLWFVTIALVLIITSLQPGQTEFIKESLKELLTAMKQMGLPREMINEAMPYLLSMLYAGFISPIIYWSIEAFTGASPGKRILRLRIGREDGAIAEPSVIAMRTAIKMSDRILKLIVLVPIADIVARGVASASSLVEVVIVIGCFIALSAKKQALHDMIARTAVFRANEQF